MTSYPAAYSTASGISFDRHSKNSKFDIYHLCYHGNKSDLCSKVKDRTCSIRAIGRASRSYLDTSRTNRGLGNHDCLLIGPLAAVPARLVG